MADAQRSEKPTQQRLNKARKEGNFPASRELVSSVHFVGAVVLAGAFGGTILIRIARMMRRLLAIAFSGPFSVEDLTEIARDVIVPEVLPLLLGGAGLTALMVGAQLMTTKLGISGKKLMPDIKRLNPMSKIKNMPGQNMPVFVQALILVPLVSAVVYFEVTENLQSFMQLPWMGAQPAILRIGSTIETLLWRAAGLFLLVGFVDLVWQRRRYINQLKMTKQEIREEHKEQEGSPEIKARVRRLQRDLLRRNMMKEVPNATAIITNPTHYAVAIRYEMPKPGEVGMAPKVVAKGKNFLAARIRKKAMEHQIPIVENPPLARALYSSVDVGQEIPAHLFRAVAEVLAYIYKLMGRLPG